MDDRGSRRTEGGRGGRFEYLASEMCHEPEYGFMRKLWVTLFTSCGSQSGVFVDFFVVFSVSGVININKIF